MGIVRIRVQKILKDCDLIRLCEVLTEYGKWKESSVVVPARILLPIMLNHIKARKMMEGRKKRWMK